MTSICMICRREILPNRRPGQRLPPSWGYSHGCCYQCVPEMCRRAGLSERQIAEIIAASETAPARSGEARQLRVQPEAQTVAA